MLLSFVMGETEQLDLLVIHIWRFLGSDSPDLKPLNAVRNEKSTLEYEIA